MQCITFNLLLNLIQETGLTSLYEMYMFFPFYFESLASSVSDLDAISNKEPGLGILPETGETGG